MLIIGSKAFKRNFPELNRNIKDIDIIVSNSELQYLIDKLDPKEIKYNHNCVSLVNITKQDIFDTDNVELFVYDQSPALTSYMEYENAKEGIHYASNETIFSLFKKYR